MLDFVHAVAKQASLARKSLLLSEAKAERRVLDRQLDLAREIQSNLSPSNLVQVAGVDTAVFYKPAMWVGGDYCDMWPLGDGLVAFAVGDVSGKGLAAAMVMSNLQAALRTTMSFCTDLDEAVEHIDKHLSKTIPEHMFKTMFLGVFNPGDCKLQYVNAGHILPVVMRVGGPAADLGRPVNPPVGLAIGTFQAKQETIEPGAKVVVVTDGITEVVSPEGEEFGQHRLRQALESSSGSSAEETVGAVTSAARRFRGDLPQQDDITVFALRNVKQ
jgi:sigma-B regulation protein RsbU (phosphoserine phosphatase)